MAALGTQHRITLFPQANGLIERLHQQLKGALRMLQTIEPMDRGTSFWGVAGYQIICKGQLVHYNTYPLM